MTRCVPVRRFAMLMFLLLAIAAPVAAQTRLASNAHIGCAEARTLQHVPEDHEEPRASRLFASRHWRSVAVSRDHRRIGAMVGGCSAHSPDPDPLGACVHDPVRTPADCLSFFTASPGASDNAFQPDADRTFAHPHLLSHAARGQPDLSGILSSRCRQARSPPSMH